MPEQETGADVLVQRLLWAAGYNVPENSILEFERAQLQVDAFTKLEFAPGHERALSRQTFDAALELAARTPDDARLRAIASRYLEGKPIGGYPIEGVRADDPNDRVPHQDRRDVRGLRLFYAWLGQTNVEEPNTLDMWVEHPAGTQRGTVTHYVLDFGKALGTWGVEGHEHDGYAPHFDWGYAFLSLVGLGLWPWPWEGLDPPRFRGVGRFQAAGFSPEHFSVANPYTPFLWSDRFDDYWAAKIIARFKPEHIEAAIEQAHYSDPDARVYLRNTLLARQRAVVALGIRPGQPARCFRGPRRLARPPAVLSRSDDRPRLRTGPGHALRVACVRLRRRCPAIQSHDRCQHKRHGLRRRPTDRVAATRSTRCVVLWTTRGEKSSPR